MRGRSVLLAALQALMLAALTRPALACAPAGPPGSEVYVDREEALIIWDEATHTEHFIRSARFAGSARSFGFLVPTPSRPVLAEAGEGLGNALRALSAPAIVHRTRLDPVPVGCTAVPLGFIARHTSSSPGPEFEAATSDAPPVRVLEEKQVSGLDTAVLEADDVNALGTWLEAHHFDFRPALRRWLAPYIARHWKITAFRYATTGDADAPPPPQPQKPCACLPGDPVCSCDSTDTPVDVDDAANGMLASSRLVRLSFTTDVPVYPYREPDDTVPVPSRELRLFVIAGSSVAARLVGAHSRPWPVPVTFASKVTPTPELSAALTGLKLPAEFWLSDFDDHAAQRPTADLTFSVDAKPRKVLPSRQIQFDDQKLPIPYELPFIIWGFFLWRRRRARIAAELAE